MNPLRRVLPYARRYRAGIVVGLVLVAVSNLAGVAMPWLIGRAIDLLEATGVTLAAIAGYAGLIVGATAVSGAARFGMRKLLNSVSRRIENDLREDVFEHLLRLDARFYGRMPTGELMSRLTNDTQAVRMAIGPGVMYMVNTLVLGVLAVAVMISYDLRLTLLSLIPLVFLGPVMGYFGRIIHRRFERIQKHFGVLSTMVQENLSGVRIVRAYTQESAQEAEFDVLNREYFDRNMSLARTSAMFHPLLAILTGLGVLAVLWFGSLDVMAGRISAGDFVAFFFYLALLIWPMIAIGWVVNLFQRGAASMSRIAEILDADPAIVEPGEPAAVATIEGDIEFRDVWFRYPGTDRDVLCGVTFRIPAGATAAIVGPTGAGKSTIIALMTRRYDPTHGQVLLDGTPLDRIPLDTLRAAVALVPQDAFVFSETIADNIALGLPPGAGRDGRIEAAARVAQLDEAIAVFPLGFKTRLGERGVNLSGGQRQRTTLARALARNAPVLILDDSLSAVDTHTETAILEGLGSVFTGRTAVVVSHRVSAVMNADTILVLEAGRIVERGLHADLVAAGGLYATLLRRQLLAERLEAEPVAADSDGTIRSL
ncbi:MAG TPA: ABC transporter ATP-binding protein [Longimicrobiales bacterium]|nr:ABC transporter ATP-binding protein [Longimicrobiales bacterium]